MQYLGESVTTAADWVVEDLRVHDGVGGVIALDEAGNGKHLISPCVLSSALIMALLFHSGVVLELPRHVSRCHQGGRRSTNRHIR